MFSVTVSKHVVLFVLLICYHYLLDNTIPHLPLLYLTKTNYLFKWLILYHIHSGTVQATVTIKSAFLIRNLYMAQRAHKLCADWKGS
jgi:hypothetical protein